MNNVVIVVPHGDDEVLGFAGAIQYHVAKGDSVTVVFTRSANPNCMRTEQQLEDTKTAKQILGYQNIKYLHIPEIVISDNPLILFRALESVLAEIDPSIVYTMFWGDNHQDHQIVYDCVSRIIRVWGGLNVKEFYVGETLSSTDQAIKLSNKVFAPNFYIKMNLKWFQNKIKALKSYTQEIMEPPHPRSIVGIETLARYRGMECNSEFAEAYIALRTII